MKTGILGTETAKGDAVSLTVTSGGGWLSVGLDSEAFVVSQTADRRRGAGVSEFWGEFENHGARKKRDLKNLF